MADFYSVLEDNLPDELVSTNSNWADQLGGGPGGGPGPVLGVNVVGGPNKPPAQGPGPGGPQMNGTGDDSSGGGVGGQVGGGNPLRQMQHHQHLQHLLQQQVCSRDHHLNVSFWLDLILFCFFFFFFLLLFFLLSIIGE